MSPLFKLFRLSTAGAMTAVLASGCATTEQLPAAGSQQTVAINAVSAQGIGEKIGTVALRDSAAGLVIAADLSQLPPGPHGFHIHEKGSCAPAEKDGKMGAALAAGSHYNPTQAPHHGNPLTGHLGDLPLLNAAADGTAKATMLAPRLKAADIQNLAIMVHAGGDNYSDSPKPLGGGGERIACGVIK